MLNLQKVTLVAVSSVMIQETIESLEKSKQNINFFDTIFLSHEKPENLPINIKFIKIPELKSLDDYSKFCLFELSNYIVSEFIILIQHDGYVLRPHMWKEYFLDYDYIGAPWPNDEKWDFIRVGNGGFSLRSKKLLDSFNNLNLLFTDNGRGYYNEDMQICNFYRKKLEENGIKFAPVEVAAEFSHELDVLENVLEPFGFHKYYI